MRRTDSRRAPTDNFSDTARGPAAVLSAARRQSNLNQTDFSSTQPMGQLDRRQSNVPNQTDFSSTQAFCHSVDQEFGLGPDEDDGTLASAAGFSEAPLTSARGSQNGERSGFNKCPPPQTKRQGGRGLKATSLGPHGMAEQRAAYNSAKAPSPPAQPSKLQRTRSLAGLKGGRGGRRAVQKTSVESGDVANLVERFGKKWLEERCMESENVLELQQQTLQALENVKDKVSSMDGGGLEYEEDDSNELSAKELYELQAHANSRDQIWELLATQEIVADEQGWLLKDLTLSMEQAVKKGAEGQHEGEDWSAELLGKKAGWFDADDNTAIERLDTFAERIEDSAAAATNERAQLLKQMRKINNRLKRQANKVLKWSEIMANELGYSSVTDFIDAKQAEYDVVDNDGDSDDEDAAKAQEDADGENSALNLLYQIEQLESQLQEERKKCTEVGIEAEGASQRVMSIGVENNRLKAEVVAQRKNLRHQEEINIDLNSTMTTLQNCVKDTQAGEIANLKNEIYKLEKQVKEVHALLGPSQAKVDVANELKQAAVDRADEAQGVSEGLANELEHAQKAIVDLNESVRLKTQTIIAHEKKKFELLASITKAGGNQKALQSRLDVTVSKLKEARDQLAEARQTQVEATQQASASSAQLMKVINAQVNGSEKEKEESHKLSHAVLKKMLEPSPPKQEAIPGVVVTDANGMPIGDDDDGVALEEQAGDEVVEATVAVAREVAAALDDAGLMEEAMQVDEWRAVTIQWKSVSLKWKQQLQKSQAKATDLISKLEAQGKHVEAEEVSKLAMALSEASKPQAQSALSKRAMGYAETEFALVDINKDGQISREEFIAAYGAGRALEFDRVDVNGDGVIELQEFEAAYGTAPQPKAWVNDQKHQELNVLAALQQKNVKASQQPHLEALELVAKIADPVKMTEVALGVSKLAGRLLAAGCDQPEVILKLQNMSKDPQPSGEAVEQAAHDAHELAKELQKEGKEDEAQEVIKLAQMLNSAVVITHPVPAVWREQAGDEAPVALSAHQDLIRRRLTPKTGALDDAGTMPDYVAHGALRSLVDQKMAEAEQLLQQVTFLTQQLQITSDAKKADETRHKEEKLELRRALDAAAGRAINQCGTPEADEDLDSRAERLRLEIVMYHNRCLVLEDELQVALEAQTRAREEARRRAADGITTSEEELALSAEREFAKAVESKVEAMRDALSMAEDKVEKTVTYAEKIESALTTAKKALEDAERRVGQEETHSAELEAALDRARRHFETLQVQMASGPSEEDAKDSLQGLADSLHAKLIQAEDQNLDKDAQLAQTEHIQDQLDEISSQFAQMQEEYHMFKRETAEAEASSRADYNLLLEKLRASQRCQKSADGQWSRMDRDVKTLEKKLRRMTSKKEEIEKELDELQQNSRRQVEQLNQASIDVAQLQAEKQFLKAKVERQAAREAQLVESQRACEVALADMHALYETQTDKVTEKQEIIIHLQRVMQDMLVKHHYKVELKCHEATKGLQQQLTILRRELGKRTAAAGETQLLRTARHGIKMGGKTAVPSATGIGNWTAPLTDMIPHQSRNLL